MAASETSVTASRASRFQDIIRAARTDAELTQQALADRLNVRQSTVSAWEMGVARPKTPLLVAISRELNLDLSVLTAAAAEPIEEPRA